MIQHWLRDLLHESFFHYGPRGLMWWQWLGIPITAALALVIGWPLGSISRRILQRLFKKTRTDWDDRLFARVGVALYMLWAIAVFRVLLPSLELPAHAHDFVLQVLAGLVVVTSFWALWRSVDVFFELLMERSWAYDNPSARSLISFTGNFAKAAVAFVGAVSTIAAFGYPIATVLAGVGIGGIALAFGAQKTVENLFGSVALATDQPFRVGDAVKIDDIVGTVERVGTRSTRIRTLDRSLVTFPNGRLADMRIETFAARDRIRFATMIGVAPATTEAQLKRLLEAMEQVLKTHAKIWPESVVVRFSGFGASSLEIEVQCWFQTADYDTFRTFRQEVLFGFMRAIEQAGTTFALPTHTVQLVAATPASIRKATDGHQS